MTFQANNPRSNYEFRGLNVARPMASRIIVITLVGSGRG